MRGNEATIRCLMYRWLEKFTIPMRGNELSMLTLAAPAVGITFTIPMRGNENVTPIADAWGTAAKVYDPHEG